MLVIEFLDTYNEITSMANGIPFSYVRAGFAEIWKTVFYPQSLFTHILLSKSFVSIRWGARELFEFFTTFLIDRFTCKVVKTNQTYFTLSRFGGEL